MPEEPPKPLSPARVWSSVLINQLATPGLGSLMCRRHIAGSLQLLLALAGFFSGLTWMGHYFYQLATRPDDGYMPDGSYARFGKWGLVCFGAAWLWSLATSLSLLRQVRAAEAENPPRITKPPPQI